MPHTYLARGTHAWGTGATHSWVTSATHEWVLLEGNLGLFPKA